MVSVTSKIILKADFLKLKIKFKNYSKYFFKTNALCINHCLSVMYLVKIRRNPMKLYISQDAFWRSDKVPFSLYKNVYN